MKNTNKPKVYRIIGTTTFEYNEVTGSYTRVSSAKQPKKVTIYV